MTSRTDFAIYKKTLATAKKSVPVGESFQSTMPVSFCGNPQKFLEHAESNGFYPEHIHMMPNGGTSPAGYPIGGVVTFEHRGAMN